MFTRAITRKPCKALIDGISTGQFCDGTPDYDAAVKQHDIYVATLRELGLDVTELDADERFPDSCFVEDPAVVMERCCCHHQSGDGFPETARSTRSSTRSASSTMMIRFSISKRRAPWKAAT